MTAYKNFVDDFPSRCRDILNLARKPASLKDREVTLMLMVASAGLVIPYERLKPDGNGINHPSGDNKHFDHAAEKLKSVLDESVLSSSVWGKSFSTWQYGKLKSVTGDPDSWAELKPNQRKFFQSNKKVGHVVRVLRNALAHGNIFTSGSPIEAIIFIRTKTNNQGEVRSYSFVFVTPKDFQIFLEKWFDFLNQIHIPQTEAFKVLKNAA